MLNVLIVDDEPEICSLVADILTSRLICQCETTYNGLDAFLKLQEKQYDLLITDHKMPFMTGAALIVAMQTKPNLNHSTPAIMLSGHFSKDGLNELNLKNVDFLGKPVKIDELVKLVKNFAL
jgi:CheY-like chemotaxis protein